MSSVTTPQQFGAKGDGVADDTGAFLAALAARGPHGIHIFVPSGIYRITAPIAVTTPGVKISGEGFSSILQGETGTDPVMSLAGTDQAPSGFQLRDMTFRPVTSIGDLLQVNSNNPNFVSDVLVQDCFFDYYGGAQPLPTAYAIRMSSLVITASVVDCTFRACANGAYLCGNIVAIIRPIMSNGTLRDGTRGTTAITVAGQSILVDHALVENWGTRGIEIIAGSGTTISNNYFENNTGDDIWVGNDGVRGHYSTDTLLLQNHCASPTSMHSLIMPGTALQVTAIGNEFQAPVTILPDPLGNPIQYTSIGNRYFRGLADNRNIGASIGLIVDDGTLVLPNGPKIVTGGYNPNGVVAAPIGSLFLRIIDGSAGSTLYVKEGGSTGNTGWASK